MKHEKLHAVWREAHFQVKMYKAHHVRCCGAKHISKSKCTNHTMFGPLLEVVMSKKCTLLWREAHFQVKMHKTHHVRTTFGSWDVEKVHAVVARSTFPRCGFAWQAWGIHLAKWAKWGFCGISKNDGKRFAADLQRCIFRGRRSTKKTCSWERLGGQGADFLRGVTFWSIRSVGLLRWFCVTGAALRMTWHQFFVAGAIL